mmetsp:Transcript_25781/g.30384  ORF Transcript_25781/g.30384 Transcript_25781/m.30384 type:complete len:382 (+) Transcript_25781:62-1207(+)
MENEAAEIKLLISFRGERVELLLKPKTLVFQIKTQLASSTKADAQMLASDVKLIYKGKILSDDNVDLYDKIVHTEKSFSKKSSNKGIRLIATGISSIEAGNHNNRQVESLRNAPRIRDDLTESGRKDIAARQQLGKMTLSKVANGHQYSRRNYSVGKLETLPMLPNEAKAREILKSLANDPGVLSCMEKHQWNIGCLAEMYPEGKVGESEVCIMGLNRNKGQKILLRLRTDDLKGFRKISNIRKVFFHELAHNVHSEHDNKFFKLMRQIEQECNDMNWMQGPGHTTGNYFVAGPSSIDTSTDDNSNHAIQGGTYILGGKRVNTSKLLSARELGARAAMMRLSEEEKEIEQSCGCCESQNISSLRPDSKSATTSENIEDEDN